MNTLKLFLWPMRKAYAFLARSYDLFCLGIEYVQTFLIKARNQIQPEIRLLNGVSRKVSIIIPNYNGQRYLGECIDSLFQLDFPRENYEIIVVDNASSDTSREFILSRYPDVVLIESKENLGFASGCNLGIKNSRGEYIVLLNNDTVVDTNWLKELVAVADGDENIAIAGSKLLYMHSPNEIQNAMSYLTDNGDGGDMGSHQPDQGQYDTTREVMAVCGASMLIKRTLMEEIGALDEDFFAYYEDMDLCYRTRLYGKKIVFAPKSVVYHVHAATSGEWSPLFTFLVLRNKLLIHLKNSHFGFLLKVLFLYFRQVVYEGLVKGVNRKTHLKVLVSFVAKLPKFLLKRLYVRLIIKRVSDGRVLLRLSKVKPKVDASSVKKVCVYNAYLPTMGGGENLTAHIISYINQIFPSASIDILCHETEAFDRSKFAGKEFIQILEREFDLPVKNTAVRFLDFNFNQKSLIGRARYFYRLASITKEYDLFINNTYASLVPARAKVSIYSCMFPMKLDHFGVSPMRPFLKIFYQRFLMSYDMFLSISQYTQKWVDRYWNVNSYVQYPPVKAKKNPLNPCKEDIIVNVGRFFASGHNKKQDVMVQAFIEMVENGLAGDWKLVLVGRKHSDAESSSYIQSLEETAKGYPIELLYDTSADELQDLLSRAKIYWHATGYNEALDINPEKFEHFGLSTIEAAQFGAVPVVFNGGGQPEIINHARNGFLWNTTDELMDYTEVLMKNNDLLNDLSKAAQSSMEIFSEEKQLKWFVLFLGSYYKFDQ
ncbi:MAG: glycosyltransferase [Anaerolineales bacterium]|nr:glycosyltransferase [Anaerolineales bacterium]